MTKSQSLRLKALAASVGEFIRYWGFRRIHGQLWTHIYLSPEPLSGADMVRALGVSKALVSPALVELAEFGLIKEISADGRTKKYAASPDVFSVIREILRTRENVLIGKAAKHYHLLKDQAETGVDRDRLATIGEMISAASFAIDVVLKSSDNGALGVWSVFDEILRN